MDVTVLCPYCQGVTELVSGFRVYPHRADLYSKRYYLCASCDAYVGCHPDSEKPLGRLANKELRKAKSEAHLIFDSLWKKRKMSRTQAYSWLAYHLGIPKEECHIGMFDVETCQKVIRLCEERS